ncbi:MAG: DUF3995 domain-containing protein [Leptospirales bacterium]|nr:DUF3995 domain-containing protein [Leptospirales bacterium]
MTLIQAAAVFCGVTCGLLALLHVYWAFGGKIGILAALPEQGGKPVFTPSKSMTILVALALGFAAIVALHAGHVLTSTVLSSRLSAWFCLGLAAVFLFRAIGDFKLVGFAKTVKGTRFARQDTLYYSPLCLLLSSGYFVVGYW